MKWVNVLDGDLAEVGDLRGHRRHRQRPDAHLRRKAVLRNCRVAVHGFDSRPLVLLPEDQIENIQLDLLYYAEQLYLAVTVLGVHIAILSKNISEVNR